MTTPIKVEQVDRDLRDALEHCAHMDKLGNGFLTDDALPILAAARIAAEAKTREEDAGIAEVWGQQYDTGENSGLGIGDLLKGADEEIATAIRSRMETDNA